MHELFGVNARLHMEANPMSMLTCIKIALTIVLLANCQDSFAQVSTDELDMPTEFGRAGQDVAQAVEKAMREQVELDQGRDYQAMLRAAEEELLRLDNTYPDSMDSPEIRAIEHASEKALGPGLEPAGSSDMRAIFHAAEEELLRLDSHEEPLEIQNTRTIATQDEEVMRQSMEPTDNSDAQVMLRAVEEALLRLDSRTEPVENPDSRAIEAGAEEMIQRGLESTDSSAAQAILYAAEEALLRLDSPTEPAELPDILTVKTRDEEAIRLDQELTDSRGLQGTQFAVEEEQLRLDIQAIAQAAQAQAQAQMQAQTQARSRTRKQHDIGADVAKALIHALEDDFARLKKHLRMIKNTDPGTADGTVDVNDTRHGHPAPVTDNQEEPTHPVNEDSAEEDTGEDQMAVKPGSAIELDSVDSDRITPKPVSTYLVQKGDTLFSISQKIYGDPKLYYKIFEANREQLPSYDRVEVGQILTIPK